MKKILILLNIWLVSTTLAQAQEAPCSATTIPIQSCATGSPTYTTVTIGSTSDISASASTCNDNGKDAWAKIVVPAGVEGVAIYVDDYGGCSGFLCLSNITGEWYSEGASCSSLSQFGSCFGMDNTGAVVARLFGIPSGGGTYYIRITEDDNQGGWVRFAAMRNSGDISTAPVPLATASGTYCNFWANGSDCSAVNTGGCIGTVDNTIFYSFTVTSGTVQPINFNLTGISCAGSMQMAIVATNCTGSALASKCSITSSADQLVAPTLANGNYLLVVDGTAGDKCSWGIQSSIICNISSITATPTSATCNDNGTPGDLTDDYYLANVVIAFTGRPATGTLDLSGSALHSTNTVSSVAVAGTTTTTSHTFTGVRLKANGATNALTAAFSASGTCTFTNSSIAPVSALPATVSISGTTTFCNTPNTTLTATTGTGYTYAWAASGGGVITGSTTGSSINATAAGTYTVTVSNAAGCTRTANTTIVVNTVTTPTVTGTSSICSGSPTTLDAGAGYTAYAWGFSAGGAISSATNTQSIIATAAATYTVTVTGTGGCTATASKTITAVANPATPTITGASSVCAGASTTLDAGLGYTTFAWAASGGGATSGSTSSQNLTAVGAGTYTVTVSNTGGCTATASKTITGQSAINVCENSTFTAAATGAFTTSPYRRTYFTVCGGIVKGQNTTGSFNLTSMGLTAAANATNCLVYVVNDDGTATLPANNAAYTVSGSCFTQTSSCITINAPPTPTISGVATICAGSPTTLTASAGSGYNWAASGGGTITGGTTAQNITATTAGTYTVTVTNAAGCSNTASVTVTTFANPATPTIAGASSVCAGGSTTLDAGLGYTTLSWSASGGGGISGSTTGQTIAATAAGTYTVTVSNTAGCTVTASKTITSATPVSVCENGTFTAAATGANTTSPYRRTYFTVCGGIVKGQNTTGSFNISGMGLTAAANANNCLVYVVNDDGTATLPANNAAYTVSGSCFTQTSACLDIKTAPSPTISGTTSFCAGGSTTLDAGAGFTSYAWSGGTISGATNGQTITATAAGTYVVTVSNAEGCSATANAVVTVNALPTATLTKAGDVNCNTPSTLLTAGTGAQYDFGSGFSATNTATVFPSATTTYTVTVSSAAGCTASASVTVNADYAPPTPGITGVTTVNCTSPSTTLTANGGASYLWNTGDATASATVAPITSTTYTVDVTGTNGCVASTSATVTVDKTLPTPGITGTTTICNGASTTLTASGGTAYQWVGGPATAANTVSPTTNTTYTVTVTAANGCTESSSTDVTVNALPNVTISATQTCANATLTASGANTYLWSPGGSTSNPLVVTSSGTYTVVGTNTATGCTASAVQVISLSGGASASNFGTFASAANFNVSGSSSFYNTNTQQPDPNAIGSTTFVNANLGSFGYRSGNLIFNGGEIKTWKSGTGNVCLPVMKYRIYKTGTTPPAFSSQTFGFKASCPSGGGTFSDGFGPCTNSGDQKWDFLAINNNLTNLCPDNYTIEVYYEVSGSDSGGGCGTTLFDNNVCANYKATFTINPYPTAMTGSVITCASPNSTLTVTAPAPASGITYDFGSGASTSNITTVSSAGVYTVTVSHNGCVATAATTVTANKTDPTADAGTDVTLTCTTPSTAIGSASVVGNTYAWLPATGLSATNISSPTSNGTTTQTYTVTVTTTANGCTATDAVVVTANKTAPTASISGTTTYCLNDVATALTASGGGTYTWAGSGVNGPPSGSGATITPLTTNAGGTNYTVTVTTPANGCTSTTVSTVTVNNCACPIPPSVAITQATVATCGTVLVTLNYTVANGPASLSHNGAGTLSTSSLANGTGTFTYTPVGSDAGNTVIVTAMIADPDGIGVCTASSDNIAITVNALPAAVAGSNSPVACVGAINLSSSGGGTYAWSGPGGFASSLQNPIRALATTAIAGTYTVTVTGTNGCTASTSTTVMVASCEFLFGTLDPCSCNNDATTNNLNSGTFSESIIIGVDNDSDGTLDGDLPASWDINILTVTNAIGLVTGTSSFSMQNNASTNNFDALKATFSHTDNVGYQISFEVLDDLGNRVDANGDAVIDNNDIVIIANKCAYPTPAFNPSLPASVCAVAGSTINLSAVDNEPGNPGGAATFTVNGSAAAQLSTATAGIYTVVMLYDGANDASTDSLDPVNTTAVALPNGGQAGSTLVGLTAPGFPGCLQSISTVVDVQNCCAPNPGTW